MTVESRSPRRWWLRMLVASGALVALLAGFYFLTPVVMLHYYARRWRANSGRKGEDWESLEQAALLACRLGTGRERVRELLGGCDGPSLAGLSASPPVRARVLRLDREVDRALASKYLAAALRRAGVEALEPGDGQALLLPKSGAIDVVPEDSVAGAVSRLPAGRGRVPYPLPVPRAVYDGLPETDSVMVATGGSFIIGRALPLCWTTCTNTSSGELVMHFDESGRPLRLEYSHAIAARLLVDSTILWSRGP